MKKILFFAMAIMAMTACCNECEKQLQEKVESYAVVEVTSPLYDALSENDKKIVGLFREAADIMDGLFWKQTFGDKASIDALPEGYAKTYAYINYGAWDHTLVAESLLPEKAVHDVSSLAEKTNDLLVILRKCVVKRRSDFHHCIALHFLL